MNGNRLNHIEHQTVIFALLFHLGKGILAPNLTGLYVIHRRNDGTHTGDLRDVLKGNGIAFAVPTERKFHFHSSILFLKFGIKILQAYYKS